MRAAREARGWTVEQMADAVCATPLEVSAWESGAVAAPPLQAAWVQWMLATDRWHAVTGTPSAPCGWVRAHAPHLYEAMPADLSGLSWYWNSPEVQAHFAGCATCEGRWRALERLGPQPPEPDEARFYTLRVRYRRWVQRLPRWARAPFRLLGDYWIVAAISAGVVTMPDPGLPARITGVGMGTLCWIVWFGGAFATLRERFPRHPFGAGFLAGGAASLMGLWAWHYFDPALPLSDPLPWAGAAAVSVAAGVWASRQSEPPGASAAEPAAAQPALAPSTEPHLLPGTRVAGLDAAPPPRAEPVPERRGSR